MFLRLLGPPLQWIIMMNAYNIHQINLNVYKRNETSSSYYISFHLNAMSGTEDDWTKQICRDIYYWNITAFVDIGLSLLTILNILHNTVLILPLLTLNKLMPASSTTMMNCLRLVYPWEITFFQLGPLPKAFLTLHKPGVSTVFHVQMRAMITLTASKKK